MGLIVDGFKSVFKSLKKLSRPYFTLEENELKFKIDSDNFYSFPITNIEIKTRHDPYVLEAYTLTLKDLHIEYIHTDTDVFWNAQALSLFKDLLKNNLKFRTMELLETKEFSHYEFLVYKINNDYLLNIIYIYEIDKEVFIVDLKGELFENLLKNFDKNYVYNFEKNRNTSLDLNVSLVKNNALNSYFAYSSN